MERRDRIGHWEVDTIVGAGHRGVVVTCVERRSRYLVTRRLDRKTAPATAAALLDALRHHDRGKLLTITFDNGLEFAHFEEVENRLELTAYFADPYSSWQRGTNENTNGLLRQYIPKGMDLTDLKDHELESYTRKLNNRPRKCLNYRTPAEVYHQRSVALQM